MTGMRPRVPYDWPVYAYMAIAVVVAVGFGYGVVSLLAMVQGK